MTAVLPPLAAGAPAPAAEPVAAGPTPAEPAALTPVEPVAPNPAEPAVLRPLTLLEPLPGFPRHREYVLVPADPAGLLLWLQSVAADGPRFLVVPPAPYVPGYAPRLPAGVLADLGLPGPADARLYCLVTVPDGDVRAATANLRAPLVVGPATGRARQVVLPDAGLPIRHRLRR